MCPSGVPMGAVLGEKLVNGSVTMRVWRKSLNPVTETQNSALIRIRNDRKYDKVGVYVSAVAEDALYMSKR